MILINYVSPLKLEGRDFEISIPKFLVQKSSEKCPKNWVLLAQRNWTDYSSFSILLIIFLIPLYLNFPFFLYFSDFLGQNLPISHSPSLLAGGGT